MNTLQDLIIEIFETFMFYYSLAILVIYFILGVISALVLRKYMRESELRQSEGVLNSPFIPPISIIAPAFNEELNIVDNIKALMALYYADYEVIVVNDGSRDQTLSKVIDVFKLRKVAFLINPKIATATVRGVYRSEVRSWNNLIVVDKENGGKADALNTGLNISSGDYFIAIDVDSIIDPYALQKMIKPFLEATDKPVIATGGVIRIANSCEVREGHLVSIELPRHLLPLFQVIEYNRSFLLGRLAWSKLNGLLLISGALGLFDKQLVLDCGGYSCETVGEDMELIIRMRRFLAERKKPYRVEYIPDPLCWTEAPSSLNVFLRQRNRWTRGTIETLLKHRKVFFNPSYGLMGMLSYPFWLFFEWMAPLIECLGLLYFILIFSFGRVNYGFFLILFFFLYFFSVTITSYAVFFDHIVFFKYNKGKFLFKQIMAIFLEAFLYHPMVLYAAVKGNIDYFIFKKRSWGAMPRTGFSAAKAKKNDTKQ